MGGGEREKVQVTGTSILASPVQFKIPSMRSEKPICAPSRLSDVSPNVAIDIATGQYREGAEERHLCCNRSV